MSDKKTKTAKAMTGGEMIESRWQSVFLNVKENIMVLDRNWRILTMNHEQQGYTFATTLGRSMLDFVPAGMRPSLKREMTKLLKTGKSFDREVVIAGPDGSTAHYQTNYCPIFDAAGKVKEVAVIARDITTIRQSEIALFNSEKRFRALIENIKEGISISSRERKFIYISPAIKDILGYLPEDLLGKQTFDIYHPEDAPHIKKMVQGVLRGEPGTTARFITRVHHRDGSWRWIELTTCNQLDNPAVKGLVTNFHDITDRVMAETRLVNSERKLKQALNLANMGTWYLDFSEGVAVYSPECCLIYGLNQEDNKHDFESWLSRIHPEDVKGVMEVIKKSESEYSPNQFVARIIRPDGSVRSVSQITNYEFDQKGRAIAAYGIVRDVTDEIASESSLLQEAFNGQEAERKRIAADLHDGLGQYISAIGFANFQLQQQFKNSGAGKSNKAFNQMQKLIQEAGLELKAITHNLSPHHLEQYGLVIAAMDYCKQTARMCGVKINFSSKGIDKRLPSEIEITVYRLIQELLNNVIKHAACRQARVRISLTGGLLRLTVADNGKGFKTESLKRGLGLQNINSRLKPFNGKIEIESKLKQGTTVLITIPL